MPESKVLLSGLGIPESPRWHGGRLWFCNWVGTGGFSAARVAEGGKVLQRVELQENRAPFALMLGGPDRRTLFICTAEWHKADGAPANLERLATGPRTGEILALPVGGARHRPAVTANRAAGTGSSGVGGPGSYM